MDKLDSILDSCEALNARMDALEAGRQDAFNEEDHPRGEDGKFGSGPGSTKNVPTAQLKNGYVAHDYGVMRNYHRYQATHPKKPDVHNISHDLEGKVLSHSIQTPHVHRTVKGMHHGNKVKFMDPEESEIKYKKMHEQIRQAGS